MTYTVLGGTLNRTHSLTLLSAAWKNLVSAKWEEGMGKFAILANKSPYLRNGVR